MREYITNAFKTLEDLDITVDEVVLNEADEEVEANSVSDLINNESSYNIVHDIEIDGVPYSVYIECTCEGDSCDTTFGEFDFANIDGVIVDLLDSDRNFIGVLNGVSLDTTMDELTSKAKDMIGGSTKEVVTPIEGEEESEEEPDSNERIFLGGEEPVEESVEKEECDCEDSEDCEECEEEKLNESKAFDLQKDDEIQEAKEELEKAETEDTIEQIVDVSAESVDDLKKTYIGSVILQCPTCKTMIYKNPDDLVKSEDDEELYNIEEECPHCGAKDGFEIVGQVASLNTDPEAEPEAPIEEPVEEPKDEEPSEKGPSPIEGEEDDDVKFESLDEELFNKLVNRYLNETYSNIDKYETTSAYIDNSNNTIILEGKLVFKSGKEKVTRFVFEAKELTKRGKIKFLGLNETFSNKKAFTLACNVTENKLLSENLSYNYKIDNIKVVGKVGLSKKR